VPAPTQGCQGVRDGSKAQERCGGCPPESNPNMNAGRGHRAALGNFSDRREHLVMEGAHHSTVVPFKSGASADGVDGVAVATRGRGPATMYVGPAPRSRR
jgi:hypothetical protein